MQTAHLTFFCCCRFFVYWLILFLVHNMAICLFRTIGALARDLVVANAIGSLALLAIMMMGGFVIPKASVHPWVVWVYWIDPLQYAQRALIINEFTASRWGALGPQLLSLRAFPNHYWCAISLCFQVCLFRVYTLHATLNTKLVKTLVKPACLTACIWLHTSRL